MLQVYEVFQIIGLWLICVLAAERVVEILIHGDVFLWWRNLLASLALHNESNNWLIKFFLNIKCIIFYIPYKIFTCAFCLSFWVSSFFSLYLPGSYYTYGDDEYVWYIPKVFALMALANFWHVIFRRIHRGMIKTVDNQTTLILDPSVVDILDRLVNHGEYDGACDESEADTTETDQV